MRERVFVTGGSGAIGGAIVRGAVAAGYDVGFSYFEDRLAAEALAKETGAAAFLLDVRDVAAVDSVVAGFAGEAGLDAVVCAAGIVRPGLLLTTSHEEILLQIAVNVGGAIATVKAALPFLLAKRKGVVALLGSVAASSPSAGQAVYAATKGAMQSFAVALGREVGKKGIRVVNVAPGPVDSEMIASTKALAGESILSRAALRRMATPDEIARVVLFVLSDASSYVTGCTLPVDGGFH